MFSVIKIQGHCIDIFIICPTSHDISHNTNRILPMHLSLIWRYGDSVDNTVENSSVFSLIQMHWLLSCGQ